MAAAPHPSPLAFIALLFLLSGETFTALRTDSGSLLHSFVVLGV